TATSSRGSPGGEARRASQRMAPLPRSRKKPELFGSPSRKTMLKTCCGVWLKASPLPRHEVGSRNRGKLALPILPSSEILEYLVPKPLGKAPLPCSLYLTTRADHDYSRY